MSSTPHTGDAAISPAGQQALMRMLRDHLTQGYLHFTAQRDPLLRTVMRQPAVAAFASQGIIAVTVEAMGAECRYSETLDAALALHEGMGATVMVDLNPRLIAPTSVPGLMRTDAQNLSTLTGRVRGPRAAQFDVLRDRHADRFGLTPNTPQADPQPDPAAARDRARAQIEALAARMGGGSFTHGPTED